MTTVIILLLVLVLVVFPLWAIVRIVSLGSQNERLERKLALLEWQLHQRHDRAPPIAAAPAAVDRPAVENGPPTAAPPAAAAAWVPAPAEALPPPLPPARDAAAATTGEFAPPAAAAAEPAGAFPAAIQWEQFMGAKLFAWLGGLAAFLGLAFFVKYSFEHGWISPEMRAALGYLFATGLVVGGLRIDRVRYAITAQTLIATGIVSLYAVTFACNAVYRFEWFREHPLLPWALMAAITVAAFALAVRLEARVVAILGILGGFLTPALLSTGRDNPGGLFGYIALLDLGLIAVALRRRWHFLVPLGAAGTIVTQIGWAAKFLAAEKAPTAMVVCLGFCGLFLGAHFFAQRGRARAGERAAGLPPPLSWPAVAFPFVAFGFAAVFLGFGTVAARPGLLFSFVFAADACLLALAWRDPRLPKIHLAAGVAVFALLAAWTSSALTTELLPWALAFYLLHGALHTAFPLVLERRRADAAPGWWSQLFPPMALLLMLGPLLALDAVSLLLWPCVLIIDAIAIGLALATGSVAAVVAVLVLTLTATGLWVFRVPISLAAAPSLLVVIGGFAVMFFFAGLYLARRLGGGRSPVAGDAHGQIPAASALLPFLLLIMVAQRLPLLNPSPVFGLGLLLVGLTLGLARALARDWLPACALVGVAALEYAWHDSRFTLEHASTALAWHVGFHAVFAAFPFIFRRRFAGSTGPWAVAALSGVLLFPLVYRTVERAWPNDFMGLLPALFALPPLASLWATLRAAPANERARLNQLAWFGGVALFFITLVFPIQFERQWITIGWALEGVALLWLFHRVPHPALRATGVVLLAAAFARLALNPAVLGYHARSGPPIFNWLLYTYGIVAGALFAGARLLAPPRERTLGVNARALLAALGTVLAFLLLNLEIADYFTPAGTRALRFEFSGNFARDMTYTIAWALFALALLLVGFWKRLRAGRYAAMALLGGTLLKLFLHDLARLEALYRIGALLAVAVIAILASFAYQRFLPSHERFADKG